MATPLDFDIPAPRQSRSIQTQQALIDAGRTILRDTPWEAVSIAMIAQKAERSVGVFYQRFGSKEEFLGVLIKLWLEEGYARIGEQKVSDGPLALIERNLDALYQRVRTNRYFWRAALQRAMDDPASWEPFRQLGTAIRRKFADDLGESRGKPLAEAERHRLDLATQVFNSVINNALLNDPGPLRVDQPEFFPTLMQIFLQIADLEL